MCACYVRRWWVDGEELLPPYGSRRRGTGGAGLRHVRGLAASIFRLLPRKEKDDLREDRREWRGEERWIFRSAGSETEKGGDGAMEERMR